MLQFLKTVFLQVAGYVCSNDDKEQLETIQREIQARLNFLKQNNLNEFNDPQLIRLYETHREIQDCIYQNPEERLMTFGIALLVTIAVIALTWIMVRKVRKSRD